MIGHGRAQPPALPHYLSGRMRGCNGPYWAPTWWDKAVGFRNKEGDKFPTLPPIRATCSNRVLVSMCATNLASSTPPTSRFYEAQLSRHITLTGEELKPILVARSYSVSSIAPQPTNAMLLRRRRMVCTWLASAFL